MFPGSKSKYKSQLMALMKDAGRELICIYDIFDESSF